jgi:hypothetical protein
MNLVVALSMLNECFNLVKERRTKIDMLHQDVYILGFEFKWLSYKGFYSIFEEGWRDHFSSSSIDPWHKSGRGPLRRHTTSL